MKTRLWWALVLSGAVTACDAKDAGADAAKAEAKSDDAAPMPPPPKAKQEPTAASASAAADGAAAPGGSSGAAAVAEGTAAAEHAADSGGASGPPPPPPETKIGTGSFEGKGPSCPTGDWCASKKDARKASDKMAQARLGCPSKVRGPAGEDRGGFGFELPRSARGDLDEAETKTKRDDGDADACCYRWVIPCPGGRPLRDGDDEVRAPVRRGAQWSAAELAASDVDADDLPEPVRAAIAMAWREDARAEHASVASFARASLELMQVGAPPDLLAATQRASLDEVDHARICFDLAAAYGEPVEPGGMALPPPRRVDVARLAVAVFEEGCVGETVAALIADVAAQGCRIEAVRERLQKIAEDEGDHAALAWQTVAWLIAQDGPRVREALAGAVAKIEARLAEDPERTPAGDADLLRAHGRLDAPMQRRLRAQAWHELVVPLLRRLLTDEELAPGALA